MRSKIKSIWIESELKGPIIGGELFVDDNSDVIVTLSNEKKYIATFFTYENIKTLSDKNKSTGECLDGKYFWASNMILIEQINRDLIEQVINDMLNDRSFVQVFTLVQ
jgi:hypothetical protein